MKRKSLLPANLDERVTITLITCSIISIAIMLRSFRNRNGEPYSYSKISFTPGTHYTGESIRFIAEGLNTSNKHTLWDFGDNLQQFENGNTAFHTYIKPGAYKVKIITDKECSSDITIYITQQLSPPDSIPQFSGPDTAIVDESVQFKDSTPTATHWEWRFGESGSVDDTVQNPIYTFNTTGNKKVILLVDGKMLGELIVFVQNKPIAHVQHESQYTPTSSLNISGGGPRGGPIRVPQDTSVKIPAIKTIPDPAYTEKYIKQMLYQVVDGEIYALNFTKDLCDLNLSVIYNGDLLTFQELCMALRAIKKSKKIKDFTVELATDQNTHCINSMIIKLKVKPWLQLLKEKIF